MINFSILITTRYRVNLLNNLLKSIYDSTFHKDEVEILVIYDTNDVETIAYVKTLENTSPIQTYFHSRERSRNLVNDYHNYYSKNHAKGKYIIFSNDDALFEMYGWDDRAMNTLNEFEKKYPDGILYGMPEDFEREPTRQQNNWMACFPLISKKAIEVLGYAFDPEFMSDGADWALAATYYSIERVVDLRNCIIIKHLSQRSGRRDWDSVDQDSRDLGISPCKSDEFIDRNRKILLKYIEEYKKNPK